MGVRHLSRIESSVIIPMHNEVSNAQRCIENVENCLKALSSPYEIVVAEDGSTDGTREVVEKVAENNPHIRCRCSRVRLGKGQALTNATKLARGNLTVIIDSDMTDNLDSLKNLIRKGKDIDGLVAGSRVLGGVANNRPTVRRITSRIYNRVVRLLFGDNIRDHQCGFKALSHNLVNAMIPYLREKGFAWDTEVIVLAKKLGYPVWEIPLRIIEKRRELKSKVNVVKDGFRMVWSLLAIKYRLMRVPRVRGMRLGTENSSRAIRRFNLISQEGSAITDSFPRRASGIR